MNTPTPRTDAELTRINEYRLDNQDVVPADFARQLETELAAAMRCVEIARTVVRRVEEGSMRSVKLYNQAKNALAESDLLAAAEKEEV